MSDPILNAQGYVSTNPMDYLASDNPQFVNGSPGLAYDTFTDPGAELAVPSVSVSAHLATSSDAVARKADASPDSGGVWGWLGSTFSKGLDVLGKGLQEIEQDYKFIHSVYTRHGFVAGFASTLGVAAGGVGGFLTAGPMGAVLGADAAAALERNILGRASWQDSKADSENDNYKVSFGRDFANGLSKVPGLVSLSSTDQGWGKLVSGTADAAFDFEFDPVMRGLAAKTAVKTGRFLEAVKDEAASYPGQMQAVGWARRSKVVSDYLLTHTQRVNSPEGINMVRWGKINPTEGDVPLKNSYNKAIEDMAGLSTGEIIRNYPKFRDFAPDLGAAHTADAVHEVMSRAFSVVDHDGRIFGPGILPSKTMMRPLTDAVRSGVWRKSWAEGADVEGSAEQAALDQRGMLANQRNFLLPRRTTLVQRDLDGKRVVAGDRQWLMGALWTPSNDYAQNVAQAVAKKVRTFTGYKSYTVTKALDALSLAKFDLLDGEALEGIRRMAYYGLGDREATRIVGKLAELQKATPAADTKGLRTEFTNLKIDVLKAAGVPDRAEIMEKAMVRAGVLADEDASRVYAIDRGIDHSNVKTPQGSDAAAVSVDQTNHHAMFIDFREMKSAIHDAGMLSKWYGKLDDVYSSKFVNQYFKPLALMTMGFGLRIAAAESIPAMMRYGGGGILWNHALRTAAKLDLKLIPGEIDHVVAAGVAAMPGHEAYEKLLLHPDNAANAQAVLDQAGVNGPTAAQRAKDIVPHARDRIREAVGPGVVKLAKSIDPDGFKVAAALVLKNEGQMLNAVGRTGKGMDHDLQSKADQSADFIEQKMAPAATGKKVISGDRYTYGDKFGRFSNSDTKFRLHLLNELQKVSQDGPLRRMATDVLEHPEGATSDTAWDIARDKGGAAIDGSVYDPTRPNNMGEKLAPKDDPLRAERRLLERYTLQADDPMGFAQDRIARLRGLVSGQDGTVHEDLLRKIASGIKPTVEDIDGIGVHALPHAVGGRELLLLPGINLLSRILQMGFKHVVDPLVNVLSREPLYLAANKIEMKWLQPHVDSGALSYDEALMISETRATHAILPQIHNTDLRTQFAVMANSFMPFYFAQEQAYKRAAHLIHSDPSAVRKYQLMYEGISNPGFVNTDANGNRYLMMPGDGAIGGFMVAAAGMLGGGVVPGLATSISGNIQSLNTVLPEIQMPGMSPMVSAVAQKLSDMFPELTDPLTTVVGQGMNSDIWDWAIPNAPIRNLVRAYRSSDTDRAFLNRYKGAEAAAYYHGQTPPPNASAFDLQAHRDRLKNNARSSFMVQALLGMVSPLAPTVTQADFTAAGEEFGQEFQKIVKKVGYIAGTQQFTAEHGSQAISYTVAGTHPETKGAYMPYTNDAIGWIQGNKDLVQSNLGTGAAFLVPQAPGGGNLQVIHDELLKMSLRAQDTPEDFLNAIYVAAGNNQIAAEAKTHSDKMKQLTNSFNSDAVDAERSKWNKYIAAFGNMNPLWWNDYQSVEKTHTAMIALNNLDTIFRNPTKLGANFETHQTELVRELYGEYVQHTNQMLSLRASGATGAAGYKNQWKDRLKQLESAEPLLAPIIRSVFLRVANL